MIPLIKESVACASSSSRVAVILLTWKRIQNLSSTLLYLSHQDLACFDTYLWNNNPSASSEVDSVVSLASIDVHVIHSSSNEGCIARHRLAFSLRQTYTHFVFIDDDQQFESDCLATLLSESNYNTLVGWWAWNLGSKYWIRKRVKPGQSANYLGCGMTIIPSSFYEPDFFDVPCQYMSLDDLWCSVYAGIKGYQLRASKVKVTMNGDDDSALYLPLYDLKQEFAEWARQRYGLPKVNLCVNVSHQARIFLKRLNSILSLYK